MLVAYTTKRKFGLSKKCNRAILLTPARKKTLPLNLHLSLLMAQTQLLNEPVKCEITFELKHVLLATR